LITDGGVYEQLVGMDAINPTMSMMDVAIVIGAGDVVNPAARGEIQPALRDADHQRG
jgi:NAD/NADP transhydrogenase beta subunit